MNALVPVDGTPFDVHSPPDVFQMARTIATARLIMPKSVVRLSAGRLSFSPLEQVRPESGAPPALATPTSLPTLPTSLHRISNEGDWSCARVSPPLSRTLSRPHAPPHLRAA